jgi:hypothetical protein
MSREFACKDCGHIGFSNGQGGLRGNFLVSSILWIFVIPGLIYSIWRRTGKGYCAKCGSTSLASLNSEYGKAAMEEFYMKQFSKNPPSSSSSKKTF